MNEKEFAELAAGAALHALSLEDELRFREALADHPEWAAEAEADAEVAMLLAAATPLVSPPDSVRSGLLAQIALTPQSELTTPQAESTPQGDEPRASAGGTPQQSSRSAAPRGMRILFALAACLALLVGAGIGAVAINSYINRPASVVALEEIQQADDAQQASVTLDDGGKATAHWSASLGTAVLVADGIASLPEDKTYELWFVRGETPVPAGVFAASDGEATAVLEGDMHEGDVIAVTVEQAGGSPTGTPTSDPVIAIPTA